MSTTQRPFTFEELRDAVLEAWISYRTNGRVQGGSLEDRLRAVEPERRAESPRKAPARMIAAGMWSGDPYGESASEEYEVRVLNALERFKAAGLMDSEPTYAASGRRFEEPRDDLWWVKDPLDT